MSLLNVDFKEKTIKRIPKVSINKKDKYQIILSLDMLPNNCEECPFYNWNESYDPEAFWGSGYSYSCPFGCSIWGCHIERPKDCPIKRS